MGRLPSKRYRPGERLRAADVNAARAEQRRQANVRAEAPLTVHNGPGGIAFGQEGGLECWAKITSGTNPYAWTEQIPQANNQWADGLRSGTTTSNAAREVNGRTDVPASTPSKPTIVRLSLSPFGDANRFAYIGCG